MARVTSLVQQRADELKIALRAALGATAAVSAARLLHLQYPIYALIAAVLVADPSAEQARKLSVQRIGGTVFGAALGALLVLALGGAWWVLGVGVLAAMISCYLAGFSGTAKVAGYVTGIVLIAHGRSPWLYALNRVIETALGLGCTLLAGLIV